MFSVSPMILAICCGERTSLKRSELLGRELMGHERTRQLARRVSNLIDVQATGEEVTLGHMIIVVSDRDYSIVIIL